MVVVEVEAVVVVVMMMMVVVAIVEAAAAERVMVVVVVVAVLVVVEVEAAAAAAEVVVVLVDVVMVEAVVVVVGEVLPCDRLAHQAGLNSKHPTRCYSNLCYISQQMSANILLFVCSNILGAIDFYIADRRQRRSVLETRQSLEVKITLESENRQQVCTLG